MQSAYNRCVILLVFVFYSNGNILVVLLLPIFPLVSLNTAPVSINLRTMSSQTQSGENVGECKKVDLTTVSI